MAQRTKLVVRLVRLRGQNSTGTSERLTPTHSAEPAAPENLWAASSPLASKTRRRHLKATGHVGCGPCLRTTADAAAAISPAFPYVRRCGDAGTSDCGGVARHEYPATKEDALAA